MIVFKREKKRIIIPKFINIEHENNNLEEENIETENDSI